MVTANKQISFTKENETEVTRTMKAVVDLINHLSTDDLAHLAEFSKRKPGWVKKAKGYERFL
jgi:hypothetical protein